MVETLTSIIENYRSGVLSTPNIQVREKTFYGEIIQFFGGLMVDNTFAYSSFQNSNLVKMKFIHVSFGSSYFKKCLLQNCIFENTSFKLAEFDHCIFKNCHFIDCNLTDITVTETVFDECTFVGSCFNNASFEFCHFLKPIFENMDGGRIGSAVLIDSKFSNSKKSIDFKGEIYFSNIFDQIKKFYLD